MTLFISKRLQALKRGLNNLQRGCYDFTLAKPYQLKRSIKMNKGDIIKLSNRETATIVKGDESVYQKIYIVKTEDGLTRVVDKKTKSVVPTHHI